MRHVWYCAGLFALLANPGDARSLERAGLPAPTLTVVLDFRGSFAPRSVDEMKREVKSILRDSGRTLEWRSWAEATETTAEEMAVVRFRGNCTIRPGLREASEGPLGFTFLSNGTVLPFSEVACERLSNLVQPTVAGLELPEAEVVLGRAMGRVVAHELVHILSRSTEHGHDGVARPELSTIQLTEGRLALSAKDLVRITGQERR
ncbi:MAG TPA: hypothetical protein VLY24_04360 [Bryobacteraceae bacterium]|nr:hypothetical protein [Bryobacteraceae bacterium]